MRCMLIVNLSSPEWGHRQQYRAVAVSGTEEGIFSGPFAVTLTFEDGTTQIFHDVTYLHIVADKDTK